MATDGTATNTESKNNGVTADGGRDTKDDEDRGLSENKGTRVRVYAGGRGRVRRGAGSATKTVD